MYLLVMRVFIFVYIRERMRQRELIGFGLIVGHTPDFVCGPLLDLLLHRYVNNECQSNCCCFFLYSQFWSQISAAS